MDDTKEAAVIEVSTDTSVALFAGPVEVPRGAVVSWVGAVPAVPVELQLLLQLVPPMASNNAAIVITHLFMGVSPFHFKPKTYQAGVLKQESEHKRKNPCHGCPCISSPVLLTIDKRG